MIAKGNPQWPQAFYPMEKEMIIAPGDTVAARCSYNTTGHDSPVKIGKKDYIFISFIKKSRCLLEYFSLHKKSNIWCFPPNWIFGSPPPPPPSQF